MNSKTLAAATLAITIAASAWAADRGYFGFALSVDGEGFFNPTVSSIKISKVMAESPAAKAGLIPGTWSSRSRATQSPAPRPMR